MIFSEGTAVIYKEMCGLIDFVCDQYVVIQLSPQPNRNSARLLVFREYYNQITIQKASTK
jgi:hypothetical protein